MIAEKGVFAKDQMPHFTFRLDIRRARITAEIHESEVSALGRIGIDEPAYGGMNPIRADQKICRGLASICEPSGDASAAGRCSLRESFSKLDPVVNKDRKPWLGGRDKYLTAMLIT